MNKTVTRKNIFRAITFIAIVIIAYFVIPVSIPLILAGITALLLEPLVLFSKRKLKMSRKLAVAFIYIISTCIITVICYFTITQLMAQIITLSKQVPHYISRLSEIWFALQANISNYTEDLPVEVISSIQNTSMEFVKKLEDSILVIFNYSKVTNLLAQIPSLLVSLIVYMIALFLFMLDVPKLKLLFFNHLKPTTAKKARIIMNRLKNAVFGFMKAQILVSFLIGGVALISLLIIQPKYAITMALIVWIIDVIPFLGSIIILAPWGIYHLLMGNTSLAIQLLVLAAVLLIIRRTVEPKVMGSHIGLSPLPTLIAMFIGLQLLGIVGIFLGPFVIILFIALKETGIIKTNFKI
ncbi:MAG: sporulation integral membrane protein YtvI [Lysinibacillus sp.]